MNIKERSNAALTDMLIDILLIILSFKDREMEYTRIEIIRVNIETTKADLIIYLLSPSIHIAFVHH